VATLTGAARADSLDRDQSLISGPLCSEPGCRSGSLHLFAFPIQSTLTDNFYSRKFTSICAITATGFSFLYPDLTFYFFHSFDRLLIQSEPSLRPFIRLLSHTKWFPRKKIGASY
jgi:hypothetical protein